MPDVARPAHLGDVHEAFDPRLELDERAVIRDRHDLALYARSNRILRGHVLPRIRLQLFQAERDALALPVDVEDFDLELLADLHHLGRMRHAAVAHVRDVQQAVHAAQVDEGPEVGDVLHHTLPHLIDRQLFHQHVAFRFALGFEQHAARHDDVPAPLVELDDLELVDRHRTFRLEADVEDDGGVGYAQDFGFDDFAFLDIRQRPLVQQGHFLDLVGRVFLVETGTDAELRAGRFTSGNVFFELFYITCFYEHSVHRFCCEFEVTSSFNVLQDSVCRAQALACETGRKPTQGTSPAPVQLPAPPAAPASARSCRATPHRSRA